MSIQKHSVESRKQILQNNKKWSHDAYIKNPATSHVTLFSVNGSLNVNEQQDALKPSRFNFGLTDINKDVVIVYTACLAYTHFKQVHYLNHIHK